ncbi:MAG: hypothetical protein DYG94_09140 [Leptolyngbya sp. PLA3]|nr:MAG: hypothetical protein EDM82_12190 [Cyanobacteria bacterium CYA]MCE7968896.1 hypothetical protein [Leptolyngbya sp. PL-A3]
MQEIDRVLKAASWRLFIIDVFRTGVVTATITLTALFALRAVEKLFPVTFDWSRLSLIAGVSAVFVAVLWAFLRRHRGLQLAREVDERAGLCESISTAMVVAGQEDGWSRLVVETARERARRVVVRDAIPIKAPRLWQAPLALAVAMVCVWWLPRYDLTGMIAREEAEKQKTHEVQRVMAEIKVDEAKLDELMRRAGVEPGAGDEPQDAEPKAVDPNQIEEIRREALRKLTNLSDQIQARQESDQAKALEAMQNQLKQLRTPGDGPLSEFSRSLARGNFADAKEQLETIAQQLAEGSMSESDRAKAQEQLENLKEQLEQLAENTKQLQQALEEAGLSAEQARQLAKAASDPQTMQQALEKMEGLSEQQKQQLQQMAQAQSQACQSCNGMAGAMGQMAQAMSQEGQQGQQASEGANAMSDQLGQLEMAQQEMQNLQAAASECQSQINKLGQSMCEGGGQPGQCFGDGQGSQGKWSEGTSMSQGNGSGGPGQGSGGAMDEQVTDFALERVKQRVENQGGPIIGQTIVYGAQVRGESKAEFRQAVAAARVEAANALEQKAVPRKYQSNVRGYFGRLPEITDKSASEKPATVEPEKKSE